eukprot:288776_1
MDALLQHAPSTGVPVNLPQRAQFSHHFVQRPWYQQVYSRPIPAYSAGAPPPKRSGLPPGASGKMAPLPKYPTLDPQFAAQLSAIGAPPPPPNIGLSRSP